MNWLLDKLKLLGVVVLLIGGLVALMIYNPFSHDDKIVELSGKLAIELCECTGPSCAERVMEDVQKRIIGQVVSAEIGGAHTKARDQIIYLEKCHDLIMRGVPFTLSKSDGRVRSVSESALGDIKLDLGGALAPP